MAFITFIMLHNYYFQLVPKHFQYPKKKPHTNLAVFPSVTFHSLLTPQSTSCPYGLVSQPWVFHINAITQYMTIYVRHLSHCIIYQYFIPFHSQVSSTPLCEYTTFSLSIRLLRNIWVVSILTVRNKAALNMHVCDFCRYMFSTFLGIYLGAQLLNYMRNLQTFWRIFKSFLLKHLHQFVFALAI